MNGKVKFYNFRKRFGFITAEDGKDYFFHQTGLVMDDQQKVRDNVSVTFDVEDSDRGPKAVNVKVIDSDDSEMSDDE